LGLLATVKHLLPKSRVFNISKGDTNHAKFWGVIADAFQPVHDFAGSTWRDMFPSDTTQLRAWESEFAFPAENLTTEQRRSRLKGEWAATGGQSKRYIQDTLHAAGFTDLFVYDWWVDDVPTARNPLLLITPTALPQAFSLTKTATS